MKTRSVAVLGTGAYLPSRRVSGEELETEHQLEPGSLTQRYKVRSRYYVEKETAAHMGGAAARQALKNAGLNINDVDVIVSASGTPDQPIPCNAALIQEELGGGATGIPCFDINSTCLSFITAFDIVSSLLDAGSFHTALIVSSEITSAGLNWKTPPTAALFSDAAAAAVLSVAEKDSSSCVVCSRMETYAEGAGFSEIRGGGTRLHASKYSTERHDDFLFRMDGHQLFKIAYRKVPEMLNAMFTDTGISLEDMDFVIPHEASQHAMDLMRQLLRVPSAQWNTNTETVGNCVAASVPLKLHLAIEQKALVRGMRCMLIGTAAGFSCGAVVFVY
jgi:3-oxoacyl-[acyl-carrier-protein] synthase-3